MRLYWEVARRGFRRYAAYQGATLAGVFTNTVFGLMRAYVMIAIFRVTTRVGGFDLRDTLTYTFVTQGMLMVVWLWGWYDIALTIRSGDIVVDLYRPFDYQFYWLSQDLGRAAYHAIARGIPPFVVGALIFHLRLPSEPITWVAFAVSVALAVCVSFSIRFIGNLSAFWLLDYRGTSRLVAAVWTFMGGFLVPVAFFPHALERAARVLPFAATVETPVEIFIEHVRGTHVLGALAYQAVWALALLAAGRAVLVHATRRVVTQGG